MHPMACPYRRQGADMFWSLNGLIMKELQHQTMGIKTCCTTSCQFELQIARNIDDVHVLPRRSM